MLNIEAQISQNSQQHAKTILKNAVDYSVVFDDVYAHVFSGYTVSSVVVRDRRRLYVAGAPRFKHKGKVILFELSNEGDVNIVQALNGEQVKLSSLVCPDTF